MGRIRQNLIWIFAVLTLAVSSPSTRADSLDVSYTYSGTSGNYTLNFAVHNNLTSITTNNQSPTQPPIPTTEVSIFGFLVDQSKVVSEPKGYVNYFSVFNTATQGYSTSSANAADPPDYNNVWNAEFTHDFDGLRIQTGSSRSGFLVHTTLTTLPESIKWFALTYSTDPSPPAYTGGDPNKYYESSDNMVLGFEGVVSDSGPSPVVPEPTTFAMTGLGCIACLAYLYRKRASIRV